MKPNRVVLWLADEEFSGRNKSLPAELLSLQRFGLEIQWCENLRSFKKLIPSLKAYPEADIVTADDDLYYRRNWLLSLYEEHMRHPEDVCAHRITKFWVDDAGEFRAAGGGYDTYPCPSYLHKFTGVGGVFYPAHCLHKDAIDADIFTRICTTNDDIWFWLMATMNGVRVCRVSNNYFYLALAYVGDTQRGPTLSSVNDHGEKLFWKDFHRVLEHYPELDSLLREEYQRMKKGA